MTVESAALSRKELTNVVTAVINEVLERPRAVLPDSVLGDDLGFDDLDLVETIMALEETYKIELPDDEFSTELTVDDLVDVIQKHISNGGKTS